MGAHPSGMSGKAWYLLFGISDPEGETSTHTIILESVQMVIMRSLYFK